MFTKTVKIIISAVILVIIMMVSFAQAEDSNQETKYLSKEELTQLLAPVALYPDALLSQMFMAATYPFEIVEASRWLEKNSTLKGEALDNALQEKSWDVSVLALCHYPKVISMMTDNLDWTARVGDAFANQEQDVLETVQELRAKAKEQGNLSTTSEQKVIVEDSQIIIQPVSLGVLYVPVYDPLWIFGPWWYPAYLPFPIYYPGISYVRSRIIFSPGIFLTFGVIGWCNFDWGARHVLIVDVERTRRFYRGVPASRSGERWHWRPDRERRYERERRAREIPVLRHSPASVSPAPDKKITERKMTPVRDKSKLRSPAQLSPAPLTNVEKERKKQIRETEGMREITPVPDTPRTGKQPPVERMPRIIDDDDSGRGAWSGKKEQGMERMKGGERQKHNR